MRVIKNFNQDWFYIAEEVAENHPNSHFQPVTLPHTNKLFLQRSVNNDDYQFVSTYHKCFSLPDEAAGKRAFLDFDGAMLKTTAYLNGTLLGVYQGGFTPFSFDITNHLLSGENRLTVYVDATESVDIPPYGGTVDFLTFGGLYRDVYLRLVNPCHIVQAFVRPCDVLTAPRLECDIQLSQWEQGLEIVGIVEDAQGQPVTSQMKVVDKAAFMLSFTDLNSMTLWSLENPALYNLRLTLSLNGKPIDNEVIRFGFRTAEFCNDGQFHLNGEPIKLFGLNRHQTYPYLGAAAPKRLQYMDAEIIRYELGCNVVRTSHYAQSPHFLNRCDEIGLLVFEEVAGWKHIGDEAWQALLLQDLKAMILRDRNHPSIMLWGVRVNESPDHDALYTQTNALAHALDPTRQTGGVRDFADSHFLEDVFTLNDFTEGIQTPRPPYLITEFGGHMFPTKTWDHEERRVEHALKHARKHNLQIGHPDVAGAIGWCAFDYATHKEFGSGDRICHHGVMDIYRLPKMAAYFYRSQKSPIDEVVLYAATNWTMGDRAGGGNNPLIVFSNCDEVEILIGDVLQGRFYPDTEQYPYLRHPPFTIKWPDPYNPWGTNFNDLEVRGYLHGELVAQQKIASDHLPHALHVMSNTSYLLADGADSARIAVQVVDRYGNVLPYQPLLVEWVLDGDAELIGENPLALLGGQGACFVKAGHTVGEVNIRVRTTGLSPASVRLKLLPDQMDNYE